MAHGDTPGVFSELKELKGSGKKAAPMTLGMHGFSEAREDLAPKKKRKRVGENISKDWMMRRLDKINEEIDGARSLEEMRSTNDKYVRHMKKARMLKMNLDD